MGALSLVVLTLTQKNFRSQTDFLLIQNQATQDFYAMSRSNEYLSNVLGEAIYSELFINEVIKTGIFKESLLPSGRQERIDSWERMIKVDKNLQRNALSVVVYNNSNNDAINISRAIGEVLTKRNVLFRSGADNAVEMRILSGPISRPHPGLGRTLLTVFAGALAGVGLSMLPAAYRRYRSTGRDRA